MPATGSSSRRRGGRSPTCACCARPRTSFLLVCEPAAHDALAVTVRRYRLASKAAIDDVRGQVALIAPLGGALEAANGVVAARAGAARAGADRGPRGGARGLAGTARVRGRAGRGERLRGPSRGRGNAAARHRLRRDDTAGRGGRRRTGGLVHEGLLRRAGADRTAALPRPGEPRPAPARVRGRRAGPARSAGQRTGARSAASRAWRCCPAVLRSALATCAARCRRTRSCSSSKGRGERLAATLVSARP